MTSSDIPGVNGVCGYLTGPHPPDTRLYPCGWRCALHTPATLAGRPEPEPGPGWPVHRQHPPDAASAPAPTGTPHEKDSSHDRTGSTSYPDPR